MIEKPVPRFGLLKVKNQIGHQDADDRLATRTCWQGAAHLQVEVKPATSLRIASCGGAGPGPMINGLDTICVS